MISVFAAFSKFATKSRHFSTVDVSVTPFGATGAKHLSSFFYLDDKEKKGFFVETPDVSAEKFLGVG